MSDPTPETLLGHISDRVAAHPAYAIDVDGTPLDEYLDSVGAGGVTPSNTVTLTNKTLSSHTNSISADDLHLRVYNNTGSTIAKGTPVYISGANIANQLPEVAPADASSLSTMPALGLTEAAIPTGTSGTVNRIGRISGVDTSAFAEQDLLYVSETAGTLTTTRPSAPAISQQIATVMYSHASLGVLDVASNVALIPATTTAVGGVELATDAETITGTDTARAVTPAGGAAAYAPLRTAPATVTGTTDTLASGDDNTVILYTAAGAVTVTLANIAVGFEAVLVSLGAGGLAAAAGGMSFANSFTPKLTVVRGEALYVKQTAASTWIVLGGTAT